MPAVRVYGTPIPKGNMTCLGPRGKGGRHLIVDAKRRELEVWQGKVTAAAGALLAKIGHQLAGPVAVSVTFTVERPKTVPLTKRPWPITRSAGGDADKLLRAVLDGLTDGGVIADDSQVASCEVWRCYPDTPGCPDRMDRPGALIRIETM
ncbi:RusA family crossover junction endodeoxyribonuclease [Microlunatus parietis]|uniref:Holliday junction resolvase RusA-like endonuclease n=1 Tax=Microlunatus parietis TaxID=682979 RepID=A0A7Y9L9K0_9ACTN|nr:RusA family crossover junction endodeoxyribonuclease [Microlunatus parietis]NYE68878.1 Holliday junction resolvase RusA-like endonuclease [Microlunatus parietis]